MLDVSINLLCLVISSYFWPLGHLGLFNIPGLSLINEEKNQSTKDQLTLELFKNFLLRSQKQRDVEIFSAFKSKAL